MARNRKIINQPHFTPPAYRWLFICIFVTLFVLIFYAMMHQFIPSPTWYALGFKLNIGFTIIMASWFYCMLRLNPASLSEVYKRYYKWFVMLSAPAIFYFLGYVAIIYSIGNIVGNFSDTPHIIHDVMQKQSVESRRGCKTRLVGKSLQHALPPNFCITQASFNQLPQEIAVRLVGKQSYFGFSLDYIEYDWEKTLKLYPSSLLLTAI
jgi:magnesium-transporting ATPase (P-type)